MMSKRRINKQQAARIEKIQQNYQHQKANDENLADGLVITRFNKQVELEDAQGKLIRCSIRPNLETIVAGDRVIWQNEGTEQGVVVSIYPRNSILAKPTMTGKPKPVAANITQMIIVIAPKPEISWPLLDSYLVMAELLQLEAVILFNKNDLPSQELQKKLLDNYQSLAYPILFTGQKDKTSIEHLEKILNYHVSVFIGQSGVGKSSLIASILPSEEGIVIGTISELSELGRHTTSNSRYYHLPHGGALIDSPGVREFSLWHIGATDITQNYREFRPFISQCKFRNCTHQNTPHCAIIKAVTEGLISLLRYENYIKLCDQYK